MEEKNYKIYDSLYNVIGVAPYEEVHTQGLLHQVVHFWLAEKKDDQLWFYLQKRAEDDIVYKGAYDILTSGHIDPEETHEEAMVHQIKEQLGLSWKKSSSHISDISISRLKKINTLIIHLYRVTCMLQTMQKKTLLMQVMS